MRRGHIGMRIIVAILQMQRVISKSQEIITPLDLVLDGISFRG